MYAYICGDITEGDIKESNVNLEDMYDPWLCCPFCNKYDERAMQSNDYVILPMIWCDNCGARAVLYFDEAVHITSNEFVNKYPECNITKYNTFIKVPLLKILRISNEQLEFYVSTKNIPDEDVLKLLGDAKKDIINKHNLVCKKTYDSDDNTDEEDDEDYEKIHEKQIFWNISLPVNSYNVLTPEVAYPDNFDLSHDGIYIHLLCANSKGEHIPVCYWGD